MGSQNCAMGCKTGRNQRLERMRFKFLPEAMSSVQNYSIWNFLSRMFQIKDCMLEWVIK